MTFPFVTFLPFSPELLCCTFPANLFAVSHFPLSHRPLKCTSVWSVYWRHPLSIWGLRPEKCGSLLFMLTGTHLYECLRTATPHLYLQNMAYVDTWNLPIRILYLYLYLYCTYFNTNWNTNTSPIRTLESVNSEKSRICI